MNIPDRDAILDDVLARWHGWQMGSKVGQGFNSRALVVGDFRNVQVQYDSQLEQTDVDLEARKCRVIDHCVREMSEPWRTAIYLDAKACYTGHAVWRSPRLPSDLMVVAIIREEARQLLALRLVAAGVIETARAA